MSSIDKQALRTDLLMANALETAKQLRELQESPVAEAIFESVVENENGKEIQFERPISDLAFAATWQLEKLAEALESAEKQNAMDVQIKARLCRESNSLHDRLREAEKRIADQRGIIASARKFISEYAGLGDVGAAEFIKIIDRAAAAGKGEAS